MKYSVIVPIYNREKSIKKCIDSILRQSEKDFELILVDDGSTDNSLNICKDFEKTDNRIIVIHKENGGVSSARNAGIDVARGKYVVFVDSDDYVDNNYLDVFDKSNADFKISGVIRVNEKRKLSIKNKIAKNSNEEIIEFLQGIYSSQPVGKCFNNSLIKKYNIKFNESFDYGEDSLFCAEYIKHSETIEYINEYTYLICDIDPNSLGKIKDKDFYVIFTSVQNCIYNYYKDNFSVQKYLINKYLWYAEKTFKEIAKSDLNYTEKINRINLILKSDYFKTCIKNCEKSSLTTVNRICYKFGLSRFILYRMKKSN